MTQEDTEDGLRTEVTSQRTRSVLTAARQLEFILRGAHRPTEGEHLEHLIRETLRERLPTRFCVSTGFISFLDGSTALSGAPLRKVSPQYDIIVWEDHGHSPLFRRGELAVVLPEAVVAIIEVTKTLSGKKLATDLKKLDWLLDAHSRPDRPSFNPFTAIMAFSSDCVLKTTLQRLEHYYNHQALVLPPLRYRWSRNLESRNWIGTPIPLFLDMVAILDAGSGSARRAIHPGSDGQSRSLVRYNAAPHSDTLQDAMDRLEGRVQTECHRRIVGEAFGLVGRDHFREFKHIFFPEAPSGILLDGASRRTGGASEHERQLKRKCAGPLGDYDNVGRYHFHDWTEDGLGPRQLPLPDGRVFEFYSDRSWGSGSYRDGHRVGVWWVQMTAPDEASWVKLHWETVSPDYDLRDLVRRQEGLWTPGSLVWLPHWFQLASVPRP